MCTVLNLLYARAIDFKKLRQNTIPFSSFYTRDECKQTMLTISEYHFIRNWRY
jgi:hypothetical protein